MQLPSAQVPYKTMQYRNDCPQHTEASRYGRRDDMGADQKIRAVGTKLTPDILSHASV